MMERKQVINGCSGGCCEKFTLPVSLTDLRLMKEEYNRVRFSESDEDQGLQKVRCENGYWRYPAPEQELDKLIAMLIPLGETDICPQLNIEFKEMEWAKERCCDGIYDFTYTHGHYHQKDDKIFALIFTCKHFDIENKLCTNYENRPQICRDFDSTCKYSGCRYRKKIDEDIQLEIESYRQSSDDKKLSVLDEEEFGDVEPENTGIRVIG